LVAEPCDVYLPPHDLECHAVKSALETLNPTRVKLTVEVPFDELKPSLDAAYKTIGSQINVPGFRAGKVPARIIDQRVGRGAVLQEAVNEALPRFYGQAVEENKLRPLGQPEVDVTEVPAEEGQDLKFTIEVDVRPQLELPDYSGIQVEVDAVDGEAAATDVEERMTALRQRFGTLTTVERVAATGDFVSIDLAASIGEDEIDSAKGISYEIGSSNMIDGLDDALVGMALEEVKTFTAPLAGGDREGENADVTVTVQSVKVRELPAHCELDDLVSCGLLALIGAVDRFDPAKGATFEQYAWTRVSGAIMDELRRQDWAPRALRRNGRAIERAKEQWQARTGRVPSDDELARDLEEVVLGVVHEHQAARAHARDLAAEL